MLNNIFHFNSYMKKLYNFVFDFTYFFNIFIIFDKKKPISRIIMGGLFWFYQFGPLEIFYLCEFRLIFLPTIL